MFSHFSRTGFGAVVLSLMLAGGAGAEPWQIAQSSGPVWFGSDAAQMVSLGSTADIPGGATVVTGDGGRAMLVRGAQTMLIGPNAVVTVPDTDREGITTILQRSGEVTFDVDRQKVQHFAVETPYLAAVVKGTQFKVTIDGERAAVSVDRGLVAVTDLVTGDEVDTAAGQRSAIDGRGARLAISGSGLLAFVTPGSPRAPLVAPLSADDLRGLQGGAGSHPSGSIQALNEVRSDNAGAGLVVAAGGGNDGGTGGTSGGTGNGTGGGATGNGGLNAVDVAAGNGGGAAPGSVSIDLGTGGVFKRSVEPPAGISPFTFALGVAFMALAAFALAYLRGAGSR